MMQETGFWAALPRPMVGLSPMDGITDASFRAITALHGQPDLMMTEFLNVDGICHGAESALRGLSYAAYERPIIAQLYGARPEPFFLVAQLVCALGFDGLDINMGCPTKKVAAQGSGAALIQDPKRAMAIIQAAKAGIQAWKEGAGLAIFDAFPKLSEWFQARPKLKEAMSARPRRAIPVSVKTRLGVDHVVIEDWIWHLLKAQPAAISIHGRTLRQGYRGEANWGHIAHAVEIAAGSGSLILGNGDLKSLEDASRRIAESGADGVLIGRAAMGNPWIFKGKERLRERFLNDKTSLQELSGHSLSEPPVPLQERFAVALEHARLFEADNDSTYFVGMRKHLGAYCRGFPGARGLRVKLLSALSCRDVAQCFATYLAEAGSQTTLHHSSEALLSRI